MVASLRRLLLLPRWQAFALIVSGSIAASELATTLSLLYYDIHDPTYWHSAVAIGAIVPGVVASLLAHLLLSLLEQLRRAHADGQRLANTDALTGTANRRQFAELARVGLAADVKQGKPTSLLLLDADNFKSINDRHGHAVGDLALQALAACCARNLREGDCLGRWGGEEFVVLLPGLDAARSHAIATRIRQAVAAEPIVANGQPLALTVSIGVVTRAATEPAALDAMVIRADAAMYCAKQSGKNRVVAADAMA